MKITTLLLLGFLPFITSQFLVAQEDLEEAAKFLKSLNAGDQSSIHWGVRKFEGPGLYISGKSNIDSDVTKVEAKVGERVEIVLEIRNGLSSEIFISDANNSSKIMEEQGGISWAIANPSPFYLLPERTLAGNLLTANSGYFTITFPYRAPSKPGIHERWINIGLCVFSMGDKRPVKVTLARKVRIIITE